MKKLVIINFDDQFINTTKILADAFNESFDGIECEREFKISPEDIGYDLRHPLDIMFRELMEEFDNYQISSKQFSNIQANFYDFVISRAILANGIQEFLFECKKNNIEVRVITNKLSKATKKCVDHYTHGLVAGVDGYYEDYSGLELIEELMKERKLSFKDVLIVSGTDFGDEYLPIYEYSKDYCGDYVFQDYVDLIDVLYDETLSFPSLAASLDIVTSNENYEKVLSLVSKYAFEIDVTGINNETQKLLVINRIERICKQENERSMLLEELIEDTIKPFLGKKKLFKQLIEELGCEVTLSCVIYCESSKVNPSVSPSKEVVKFLGEVNIDLEYSLYC